jgi:hypothetical protein
VATGLSCGNFFIFFFDFRKINTRIKNFEKYTSTAVPHGGSIPAAIPHGLKSLLPFDALFLENSCIYVFWKWEEWELPPFHIRATNKNN